MNRNPHGFSFLSLTSRVTLLVSVMLTLSILLLGWQVERSISHHFLSQDIDELTVVANSVKTSLSNISHHFSSKRNEAVVNRSKNTAKKNENTVLNYHQHLEQSVAGHHGIFFVVLDENKEKTYQNSGPNFNSLIQGLSPVTTISEQTLITWQNENNSYHGVLLQLNTQANKKDSVALYGVENTDQNFSNTLPIPHYIFVATLTTSHQHYLQQFSQNLWLILVFSLLLIITAVWQIVRYSHQPLYNISKQIKSISTEQLSTRLAEEELPVELTGLVISLNQLLARIETSYLKLSHFSSDIAHELRTPVTNLMTQTQVSLNKARDVTAYREVLYSNLEEYERMAKMISDMLLLAKAEHGLLATDMKQLNILDEIIALQEYFEMAATEQNITLSLINNFEDSAKTAVIGDQAMLRRALSNLYSNALRYTPQGNTIVTTLSQQNGYIIVSVKNPGEIIPKAQLPHIFDRFYRGDSSRKRTTEGVGLGLAITQAIVKFHHGEISVSSSEEATIFTIKLALSKPKTPLLHF